MNQVITKETGGYPSYKPSGLKWVKEIPNHWDVQSFRNILSERNEKNDPVRSKERLSLSIDKGITLYSEKTTNLDRFKDDFNQYKLAHKNDLVFNSMNMIVGAVGVSDYFGCVSPVYYTYSGVKNNTKYYEYLFRCKTIQRVLYSLGKGLMAIDRGDGKYNTLRLKVSRDDLKSLKLPVPTEPEQESIVDFLNEKTEKIEKAIAQKEKLIELLKERKQIIIQNAVIKGLNSNVEMKPSGIDWIGDIPEKWEKNKLGYIFKFGKGLSITKENLQENGVPCVSYGEIHSKYGFDLKPERDELKCVDSTYLISDSKSYLKKGDFVFADTSEDIQGSGNFTFLDSDQKVFAGYHTVVAKPVKKFNSRYLAYLLSSENIRNQVRSKVSGTKVYSITQKILKTVVVPLPNYKEQAEIVEYLDIRVDKINNLITVQKNQIDQIKEYKNVLIDSAVTGKIKVTDHAK